MAWVAPVAAIAGAGLSAFGTLRAGEAASNQAAYQAQVAKNNQVIADQNALYAIEAGAARSEIVGRQAGSRLGQVRAGIAANNIDVNSGSAALVQQSQREVGELEQLTEENKALLLAHGYQAQGAGFGAESGLREIAAKEAGPASYLKAGGDLLSSASLLPKKFRDAGWGDTGDWSPRPA